MSLADRKAIILRMIAERGRITWSDLDPTQLTIQRWQEPMRQLLAERKVFKCKPRRAAIRRVYYEINPEAPGMSDNRLDAQCHDHGFDPPRFGA